MTTTRLTLVAIFAASLLVGCGGGGTTLKLIPVKGTLTKGGAGLAGVTVALLADDPKSLAPALSAITDDKGAFEIQTTAGDKGAVEGTYTVVLTPAPEKVDYSNPGKRGPKKNADVIPLNFQSREKSIEKCIVKSPSTQLDIKIP